MSYSATPHAPHHAFTVSPWCDLSIGPNLVATGWVSASSAAWPSANLALLIPFVLPRRATVYKAGWYNGNTTVTGNADIGVYDSSGTLLVGYGGVARSGTATLQVVDLTDTVLPGGVLLYLGIVGSDTSQWFRVAPTTALNTAYGIVTKTSSYPLPATVSSTTPSVTTFIPQCFLELTSR